MSFLGVVSVASGLAMLAFVAWQFWGTSLGTARAQSLFRAQIVADGFPSRTIRGDALGFIRIPKLAVDVAFVEGVGPEDLADGPGHYPGTALPGEWGNVAIAGHRTTHGAPFWAIDTLRPGDVIEVQTRAGTFTYRVRWVRIAAPDDTSMLGPTDVASLTLTTCYPRFSSRQRLVVRATQVLAQPPAVAA